MDCPGQVSGPMFTRPGLAHLLHCHNASPSPFVMIGPSRSTSLSPAHSHRLIVGPTTISLPPPPHTHQGAPCCYRPYQSLQSPLVVIGPTRMHPAPCIGPTNPPTQPLLLWTPPPPLPALLLQALLKSPPIPHVIMDSIKPPHSSLVVYRAYSNPHHHPLCYCRP